MNLNSYGFRPGRFYHDAVEAIFIAINQKPKYVLGVNIKECFDNIDHQFLLTKLNTFPEMEVQIKSWLKAGIMKNTLLTTTFEKKFSKKIRCFRCLQILLYMV